MPGVDRVGVPDTNYSIGLSSRKAVCLHIVDGSYGSALSEFRRRGSQKSSHFVIAKSGTIAQCVSVLDTAYANGLSWSAWRKKWIDPEGAVVTPPWPGLTPPVNPNFQTVSIEREGHPNDIPTEAMTASTIRVLRWLREQFPTSLGHFTPHVTLIGHFEISPINRAHCPGPYVDFASLASAANGGGRYRALGVPVYQAQSCVGPLWGHLGPQEIVEVDVVYPEGTAHLADGRGFVRLHDDSLEAL
jgi:hypothetical protein